MRTLAAMALALSLLAGTAADASAAGRVPATFVGAVADGPLLTNPAVDLTGQLRTMVRSGVQTMRTVFNWAGAQPYESFDDVPPDQRERFRDEGGVPTDYTGIDDLVAAAAARHLALLPVVLVAPGWNARHPGVFASPPRGTRAYAAFSAALARRYGPGGAFWAEHPELEPQPIRNWQIWNEPSLKDFWRDQPFARAYVRLLSRSREAIRSVDPGARIVLAGLPNKSWIALRKIYKAGGRGLFDIAAFHPFTRTVKGVRTILRRDRRVMHRYHDSHRQLWVTELSWTSAKGKTSRSFGNERTRRGQARMVTHAYRMLARQRHRLHIGRVYWYTWLSRDKQHDYPFDWAGLSRVTKKGKVRSKPALRAYRRIALRLERCDAKRDRADRCSS